MPHYRYIVRVAAGVSPRLHAEIVRIGRLAMPSRRRRGLAHYLARVVVGQQLSTAAARSIWARVEAAVKQGGGRALDFFHHKNTRRLRRCGLSRAKVRALIAIREAQTRGLLSVRRLQRMTHAERSAHLRQIHGIGQWTADMVSIFYFHDPDVWPEGDVGVYRGLQQTVGKRSKRTLSRIAGAFAPYRSFLALYMWRILDGPKPAGAKAASRQPV